MFFAQNKKKHFFENQTNFFLLKSVFRWIIFFNNKQIQKNLKNNF